jgi:DNA excision repair protein ERCC-6
MIPAFIKRHNGQVPSKLLVDHFNQYCSGPRQADAFKVALGKVAKMEKRGSSMRAIWTLKAEYR